MQQSLQNRFFLLLLSVITVTFLLLLVPFWGAIFWAVALAIIFFPLQRWLTDNLGGHRTIAAALTLTCSILIVMVPVALVLVEIVREATSLYQAFEDGDLDPSSIYRSIEENVPFLPDLLSRMGVNTSNLGERLGGAVSSSSQYIAEEAFKFGRGTTNLIISLGVMLYLAFFLLRDGDYIARTLRKALPMQKDRTAKLATRFIKVTRATVKGTIIVAAVEGVLGGLLFAVLGIPAAVLWGVVMGLLSLIPALGSILVWGPAAFYLFSTGDIVQGIIMLVFGGIVVGPVDNILRPYLVGRDIRLPDYVILLSILGGIVMFGVNGLVVGPILAALFFTFWQIFIQDFDKEEKP
ncbi:AI-2E family transporter [Aliidiomarina sp. Khilg15.8]